MNNIPKVSVIIPVYNTEKYVKQAVESILHQTLKEIEVIIVNDGSDDNSLSIINELKEKDERIRVLNQRNEGMSVSRNKGISKATGKYIYFMDSDDLLENDALELCFTRCEKHNLDFIFFDASVFSSDQSLALSLLYSVNYDRKSITDEAYVYNGIEAIHLLLNNYRFTVSVCLNFINHSFMDKYSLRFYPGIIHEDQIFTFSLYLYANRIMAIHRDFFKRRIRADSIMTTAFTWKNVNGYLTVAEETLKLKKKHSKEINSAIDLYLKKTLDAFAWQAHNLPFFSQRVRLFFICLFKYKRYISTKSLLSLLIKGYF